MPPRRTVTARATTKHIGHACEGHLRGVLRHLARIRGVSVARQLPVDFPVDSDALLIDPRGKVSAIFIVAYWGEAGSSHKKLHRTRTEFNELLRARYERPDAFNDNFRVVTVIYGAKGGWKEQILSDLAAQCPP